MLVVVEDDEEDTESQLNGCVHLKALHQEGTVATKHHRIREGILSQLRADGGRDGISHSAHAKGDGGA